MQSHTLSAARSRQHWQHPTPGNSACEALQYRQHQHHHQQQQHSQDRYFTQHSAHLENLTHGQTYEWPTSRACASSCSPVPDNYAGAPLMRTVPEPNLWCYQDVYQSDPYPQHAPSYNTRPIQYATAKWHHSGHGSHPAIQQPVPLGAPPAYTSTVQHTSTSPCSGSLASQARPTVPAPFNHQVADGHKLIAIPATSAKLGSPFLRAYPTELEGHGISRELFVQFIDRLNRATVASPPIQVLGLAGNIVSFVPLHTAQIVGNAVNFAATVSTVAVSKGRAEMLLKEANSTLFKAAGLKAQVAKLDVVARLGNIPILDAEGKVDKKSSILLPFQQDEELHTMNAQHRRVQALSAWLSPLDMEPLPELDESTNVLGKMHAKVSERQRQKEENKMMKDRKKMHKGYTKDRSKEDEEYEEKMEGYLVKESRIHETGGRRMEKELRVLEKKREKLTKEHNKEVAKIERNRRKDDKEEESMRKILFLVIQRV